MANLIHNNLIKELSVLGKDASLSISQRQKVRDQLFKKMGQANLIDAVATQTEVEDLVMPLQQIKSIFSPKRIVFGIPATSGMVAAVFIVTFATGAFAQSAKPGDLLFGVRKALEAVQIAFVSDPIQKAEIQLAIVNDRLMALESTDKARISVILAESQKALTNAQGTLSGLSTDRDLNNKLKTLIESQKGVLSTLAKGNLSTTATRDTLLAMRSQLDQLINPKSSNNDVIVSIPAADDINQTEFLGGLTTSYGVPVLAYQGKIYKLIGVAVDLTSYVGSTDVQVFGSLNGDTITVHRVYIHNRLIWENTPDKDNNNLSWVEGDQNSSLR